MMAPVANANGNATATAAAEPRQRRQAGYLLLEWLIAAALGLVVLAGALTLYRMQHESFMRAADAARMREAGAAALTLVGQQIQMAGYAPLDQPALRVRVTPGLIGCQSALPAVGMTHENVGCMSESSDGAGSDAAIVRYADDGVATWPDASGEPTDCLGQGVPRHGGHAVIVNRFYVGRPNRRAEPELYCVGNGSARGPQPIVEGVDRMELRYWLRGADEPVRADAVASMQWADVVAVDLCVVVRGRRTSAARGFIDCRGRQVPSWDGRERLALSRHLALRNPAGGAAP
ncbi:MAG: PilW family protein [Trinickia sp.]|uniref:PilW family protein n=1 Tax=Trinickia sp. TaxID=2571163 RepID=UPI003F7EE1C8